MRLGPFTSALLLVLALGACSSADQAGDPAPADAGVASDAGGQAQWVAVGYSDEGAVIVSSDDGSAWSEASLDGSGLDPSGVFLRGVAAFDGTWIAAGDDDEGGAGAVFLRSDDGQQWTATSLGADAGLPSRVESVDSDPTLGFVVTVRDGEAGSFAFTTWTSTDGQTWVPAAIPPGVDTATVYHHSGIWISGSSDESCSDQINLADGGEWIADPFCEGELRAAARGPGNRWVLAGATPDGNDGLAMTSTDGVNWDTVDYPFEDPGVSVAADDEQWAITGVGELIEEDLSCCAGIWVSTDGLTWRRVNAPYVAELSSVAEANGTWVAVGWDAPDGGDSVPVAMSSTDGETWTRSEVPAAVELAAVAVAGGA